VTEINLVDEENKKEKAIAKDVTEINLVDEENIVLIKKEKPKKNIL
jgi:hypothetical protein